MKFMKDCNAYTKAISWSNAYEWIKKFNAGCTELHNEVQLGQPSDLVNEETCRIVRCLLHNDHRLAVSGTHYEIAAWYT